MKSITQEYKALYQKSHKNNKKNITRKVISLLRASSSEVRFLKQKKTGGEMVWQEASEDEIWNKVSHSLRCMKVFKKDLLKKPPTSLQPQDCDDNDDMDLVAARAPKKLPRRVSDATTGNGASSTQHQPDVTLEAANKNNNSKTGRPRRSSTFCRLEQEGIAKDEADPLIFHPIIHTPAPIAADDCLSCGSVDAEQDAVFMIEDDGIVVDDIETSFDRQTEIQDFPHVIYDIADNSLITPFLDGAGEEEEERQGSFLAVPALPANIVVMQQQELASSCCSSSLSCVTSSTASSSSSVSMGTVANTAAGVEDEKDSYYYRYQYLGDNLVQYCGV